MSGCVLRGMRPNRCNGRCQMMHSRSLRGVPTRKIGARHDQDVLAVDHLQLHWGMNMNASRYYGVRVEGAKYGVGFGSALAIAISYTNNHSILWAIIDGIFGWLYVIYISLSARP